MQPVKAVKAPPGQPLEELYQALDGGPVTGPGLKTISYSQLENV